jgi:acyl-CoA synthetase (AMP-forming)/AMP-acid ligase II
MPLFHIHGLIAAVLSSLGAGGVGLVHAGLQRAAFFAQLEEAKPTWYTAVPTMHQAILTRAEPQHADAAKASQAALHPLLVGLAAAAGDA